MKPECKRTIEHFIQCKSCMSLVSRVVLARYVARIHPKAKAKVGRIRRKRNAK